MLEFLSTPAYPALFTLSFLASALIPLGSEWLLAAMLLKKTDPFAAVCLCDKFALI